MEMPTKTPAAPVLTACGRCWVCQAPRVVTCLEATLEHDRIDRDAREAAEHDRSEFGHRDPMTHLRDGHGLRDWMSERQALHACQCDPSCDSTFVRRPDSCDPCDSAREVIDELRCAWARFLTTYAAEFSRLKG